MKTSPNKICVIITLTFAVVVLGSVWLANIGIPYPLYALGAMFGAGIAIAIGASATSGRP